MGIVVYFPFPLPPPPRAFFSPLPNLLVARRGLCRGERCLMTRNAVLSHRYSVHISGKRLPLSEVSMLCILTGGAALDHAHRLSNLVS